MKDEVLDFIDFLTQLFEKNLSNSQILENIQVYFNEWDNFEFDTEETEFIYDTYINILNKLEIDSTKVGL